MRGVFMRKAVLAFTVLVVACSSGIESSATVPIDLGSEITVGNEAYEATVLDISPVEVFVHRSGELTIKDEFRDQVGLVRVEVAFKNLSDAPAFPRHGVLKVSRPEGANDDVVLALTGFCEPSGDEPLGPPIECSKLSTGSGYGVIDVYQANAVEIAPGETFRLDYILMVDLTLTEIEIGFPPAQIEDDDDGD